MQKRFRRLSFALQTAFGLAKRGYFIPYRYAGDVPEDAAGARYEAIAEIIGGYRTELEQTLGWIDGMADALSAIGEHDDPPSPRWAQSWFARLDAAAAYTLIGTLQPARLIEVGSGHSTRFFARAGKDAGIDLQIVAIDPAPRADIARLGVKTIRQPVQTVDLSLFRELRPGDVLSIDSSHILMPGSDVDYLFNRVLPLLPLGVYVHIHDVFLPFDYPAAWRWRAYNEQQGVAALLQGGGYKVIWSSSYMRANADDRIEAGPVGRIPRFENAPESSLWLLKV